MTAPVLDLAVIIICGLIGYWMISYILTLRTRRQETKDMQRLLAQEYKVQPNREDDPKRDVYAALGVSDTTTIEQIRDRYLVRPSITHTDGDRRD